MWFADESTIGLLAVEKWRIATDCSIGGMKRKISIKGNRAADVIAGLG
jgi:hypothetical protein